MAQELTSYQSNTSSPRKDYRDLPNLTTTLPGTALGKTTSTDSVLLAFLPLSISLLAFVNFSKADLGTGRVST